MPAKIYLPSFGFILFCVTLTLSVLAIRWTLGPYSYEQAASEEQKAHQLFKEGKRQDALAFFLAAADRGDDNISRARRYVYAGNAALSEPEKIRYYQTALKYNPGSRAARNGLKNLFKEISYVDTWPDGWSKGKIGKINIDTTGKKHTYTLKYFTSNPEKKEYEVMIFVDGDLDIRQTILSRKRYQRVLNLTPGKHTLALSINETFNPEKLGMSQDSRDLGVNYEIIRELKAGE